VVLIIEPQQQNFNMLRILITEAGRGLGLALVEQQLYSHPNPRFRAGKSAFSFIRG
jgi:hypothetical protein